MQYRAGMRKEPVSSAVDGLAKLGSIVGDARMLFRIWGKQPTFYLLHPPLERLTTLTLFWVTRFHFLTYLSRPLAYNSMAYLN